MDVKTPDAEFDVGAAFSAHGGDPRTLDYSRSLLVSNLPSAFVSDSFEVFEECICQMICEDFNITREALERIVRIPKLNPDAESQDSALRAIVMFKSRVHKHRVFAQKRVTNCSGISFSALDEIPKDMLEIDDIEVADEIGDEEFEGHDEVQEMDDDHDEGIEKDHVEHTEDVSDPVESAKSEGAKGTAQSDKRQEDLKSPPVKKAYVDEDEKAPFEMVWEGAPEFQWKIVSDPGDAKRLTIENLFWSDLRNPFIYRVIIRAETVDISFPMRFNHEGTKQMYGKVVLYFAYNTMIMQEAIRHLIYIRTNGRRIKILLPQTPQALKQKDELENRLGRVIQPTLRMRQLVVKILPEPADKFTIEDSKKWFPVQGDDIENFEIVDDEHCHKCAIVTMKNVYSAIDAHSSTSFITLDDEGKKKLHVFLKGVEAHFGSLLTRLDTKKSRDAGGVKRPGSAIVSSFPKRGRGLSVPLRGSRGGVRGGPSPRGFRGRGSAMRGRDFGRGGRGAFNPTSHAGSAFRFTNPDPFEDRRRELELQDRVMRQQQMLDMNSHVMDRRHSYGIPGFNDPGRDGVSGYGYQDNRRDSYLPGRSSFGDYGRR